MNEDSLEVMRPAQQPAGQHSRAICIKEAKGSTSVYTCPTCGRRTTRETMSMRRMLMACNGLTLKANYM